MHSFRDTCVGSTSIRPRSRLERHTTIHLLLSAAVQRVNQCMKERSLQHCYLRQTSPGCFRTPKANKAINSEASSSFHFFYGGLGQFKKTVRPFSLRVTLPQDNISPSAQIATKAPTVPEIVCTCLNCDCTSVQSPPKAGSPQVTTLRSERRAANA